MVDGVGLGAFGVVIVGLRVDGVELGLHSNSRCWSSSILITLLSHCGQLMNLKV